MATLPSPAQSGGQARSLVLAIVVALVGGVGLLACVAAARQGLVLDPTAALRQE